MYLSFLFKIHTLAVTNFNIDLCDPNKVKQYSFFSFPHWWKYIHQGHFDGLGNCTPEVNFPAGVWSIAFALIDMLLYLAGIVAVISIIVAGISYITAGGQPEKAASARKRIYNSLIGLAVVLVATAVVSFIGSKVG